MRKQLADIKEIDQYLLQEMSPAARLVFQARLLISPALRKQVASQQQVIQLATWLGREEKRSQLDEVFHELMQDEIFNHSITSIFK
ncbi:MAG: hypothetical protein J7623_21935 [Chitinophaga sp.]|uniref:hypothetical protein n=1 Tax=Chitinophaga sp. TaxID=1869181 RepID=UPI001B145D2D|nr:hypothetical protein [Chitinophaga sp.]MBO9731315.1 hypothetical protein [Chitinophaga sp.]